MKKLSQQNFLGLSSTPILEFSNLEAIPQKSQEFNTNSDEDGSIIQNPLLTEGSRQSLNLKFNEKFVNSMDLK